jgi:hypothetical protein
MESWAISLRTGLSSSSMNCSYADMPPKQCARMAGPLTTRSRRPSGIQKRRNSSSRRHSLSVARSPESSGPVRTWISLQWCQALAAHQGKARAKERAKERQRKHLGVDSSGRTQPMGIPFAMLSIAWRAAAQGQAPALGKTAPVTPCLPQVASDSANFLSSSVQEPAPASGKTALVTPCPIQVANDLRSLVSPLAGSPESAKLCEAVPSKPTVADRPADRPLQPGNIQSLLLPTAQADVLTPLNQQRSADRQQGPVQLSLIRVLYVFAGKQRYADVRHWLTLFQSTRGYTLTMKEVDLVRGQDVNAPGFWDSIVEELKSNSYDVAIITPPCNTHSRARCSWKRHPGPKPIRDAAHPWGFDNLRPSDQKSLDLANDFIRKTIQVCQLGQDYGFHWLVEHPEDLGVTWDLQHPASLWKLSDFRALEGNRWAWHHFGGPSSILQRSQLGYLAACTSMALPACSLDGLSFHQMANTWVRCLEIVAMAHTSSLSAHPGTAPSSPVQLQPILLPCAACWQRSSWTTF